MPYSVKEMYYTIQGEGANTGRAAVFLRFAGCNLWTGREEDRANAICNFCDTQFVGTDGPGGGRWETSYELANDVKRMWNQHAVDEDDWSSRLVVMTGGEPMLQLDHELVMCLGDHGFLIAVETNGTIEVSDYLLEHHWITVSPKAGSEVVQRSGDELKLVFPQMGLMPDTFDPEEWKFRHWFLQPKDEDLHTNLHTKQALTHVMRDPRWRLSLQTHKMIGLP